MFSKKETHKLCVSKNVRQKLEANIYQRKLTEIIFILCKWSFCKKQSFSDNSEMIQFFKNDCKSVQSVHGNQKCTQISQLLS